jgi:hypothetical protein
LFSSSRLRMQCGSIKRLADSFVFRLGTVLLSDFKATSQLQMTCNAGAD